MASDCHSIEFVGGAANEIADPFSTIELHENLSSLISIFLSLLAVSSI